MTGGCSAKWPAVVGPSGQRSFGQVADSPPANDQRSLGQMARSVEAAASARLNEPVTIIPGEVRQNRHRSVRHGCDPVGDARSVAATLYKARGVPTKHQVCAICVDRTRGRTGRVELGRGVSVWLCEEHGSQEFRTRRNGRDFVLTLQRLWSAHGCLTKDRSRALNDHLAAARSSPPGPRGRPGSYSWPALRQEAEAMFREGRPPNAVISQLRTRHRADYATVPSVRTMRRWYSDRRWMTPGRARPASDATGTTLVPIISSRTRPIDQRAGGHLANPAPPAPQPFPSPSPAENGGQDRDGLRGSTDRGP
jgi:hypothetical protein